MTAFLNGKYLDVNDAQISVLDRGFLFGDGVYEVIPAYAGRLFALDLHLQRLQNSLDAIRIDNPYTNAQWRDIFERLIAPRSEQNLTVYLQVTRGVAPRDHAFPEGVQPTVFAMSNPAKPKDPAALERGIRAVVREDFRWRRCDIKSVSLLGNVLLQQEAVDAGADTTILVRDGLVTEAAATNVFIVKDGEMSTPPLGPHLLPGISRAIVIDLAHGNDLPLRERDIPLAELYDADEVWVTGTSWEAVPVTRLDDQAVGDGEVGLMWRRVHKLFEEVKESASY